MLSGGDSDLKVIYKDFVSGSEANYQLNDWRLSHIHHLLFGSICGTIAHAVLWVIGGYLG